MIDVVIPYSPSKPSVELLCTLRSLEKHVSNIRSVVVVGHCPTFATGVRWYHHPEGNHMNDKEYNIFSKIRLACEKESVSDTFLLVHDDHFLLQDYNAETFPNYWSGYLEKQKQDCKPGNPYIKTLENTLEVIGSKFAKNFDCHCPMLIDKRRFMQTLGGLNWRKGYGYGIKSVYLHRNGLPIEYMEDLKFRQPTPYAHIKQKLEGRAWFSTDNKALNGDMLRVLRGTYPDKSKWEI